MDRNTIIAAFMVVVLVAVFFVGSGYLGKVPSELQASPQQTDYTLNLVIKDSWYNSSAGYQPAFFVLSNGSLHSSADIHLPVSQLIRVNIVSYDQGISPPFLKSAANVTGTVYDQMGIYRENTTGLDSVDAGTINQVSSVNASLVTHTFTINIPGNMVNIPVEAGYNDSAFFMISQAGNFSWGCMCPCGMAPMSTPGWMMGTVHAN